MSDPRDRGVDPRTPRASDGYAAAHGGDPARERLRHPTRWRRCSTGMRVPRMSLPAPDLARRVHAAISREPARTPPRRFLAALVGLRPAAARDAFRQSAGVALGRGRFPALVRAQALALVVLIVGVVGVAGVVGAVGVTEAVHQLRGTWTTGEPRGAHPVAVDRTVRARSPPDASRRPRPTPSPSARPTATPAPSATRSGPQGPVVRRTPEPTARAGGPRAGAARTPPTRPDPAAHPAAEGRRPGRPDAAADPDHETTGDPEATMTTTTTEPDETRTTPDGDDEHDDDSDPGGDDADDDADGDGTGHARQDHGDGAVAARARTPARAAATVVPGPKTGVRHPRDHGPALLRARGPPLVDPGRPRATCGRRPAPAPVAAAGAAGRGGGRALDRGRRARRRLGHRSSGSRSRAAAATGTVGRTRRGARGPAHPA